MHKRIHTHYDNLRVARNAPDEVIKAAHKALSRKFHPDLNPGNAEAARIMCVINASYAVLSDPEQRKRHDEQIMRAELDLIDEGQSPIHASRDKRQPGANSSSKIFTVTVWVAMIALSLFLPFYTRHHNPDPSNQPAPNQSPPASTNPVLNEPIPDTTAANPQAFTPRPTTLAPSYKTTWTRPSTAPNGKPWPKNAGYIQGYKKLRTNGLSTVTIDNSRNSADVEGKLYAEAHKTPARVFYIPAFSQFTVKNVSPGEYDFRYRDLSTGSTHKSEPFTLTETREYQSTVFDKFTLTLYKVQDGNTYMTEISESEF